MFSRSYDSEQQSHRKKEPQKGEIDEDTTLKMICYKMLKVDLSGCMGLCEFCCFLLFVHIFCDFFSSKGPELIS